MSMYDDVEKILYSKETIQKRIQEVANEMNALYSDADLPLLICNLKGAFMFLADLVRYLDFRHELDFIETSSYGAGTASSGDVRFLLDVGESIKDRNVIIVEDIVDSGITLSCILERFEARHAQSVRVVALLNKPSRREIEVPIDFCGFVVPNEFVIGYGLDYDQQYRNLPFIGVLKPAVYQGD